MNTQNSNRRLNVLTIIMCSLMAIGIALAFGVSLGGCVSNMDGHDPAAVAMDGASNILTEKPVTTATQDWYYFFRDVTHGDHR